MPLTCAASYNSIFCPAACPASPVNIIGQGSSARMISAFQYHNRSALPSLWSSGRRLHSQHPHLLPAACCSHAAAPPSHAASTSYTSMGSDPLAFWDSHEGLLSQQLLWPEQDSVGNKDAEAELLLAAQLRLLATAASDRAEMHAILAQQRDNWNKLFQRMLTAASMTSCMLSALDGQAHSICLSVPALLLSTGSAAMMAIINQFQPSQLAEEQRTAARLFRKLSTDVHYVFHVAPHLRQDTRSFLHDCRRRLQALDKAFPMPLTPGGLEKFPAKVVPPVLKEPLARSSSATCNSDLVAASPPSTTNGWDSNLTCELQEVADLLRRSDVPKYTGWAQNLVKVNKSFAVAAPLLAASAAVLNALAIASPVLPTPYLGMCAAVCNVVAAFVSSFSHDMQLGMVFELYRNSAGYYADVEASITETLHAPVVQRENGALFRQRVAYQLGRSTSCDGSTKAPLCKLVPADAQEAGTLF